MVGQVSAEAFKCPSWPDEPRRHAATKPPSRPVGSGAEQLRLFARTTVGADGKDYSPLQVTGGPGDTITGHLHPDAQAPGWPNTGTRRSSAATSSTSRPPPALLPVHQIGKVSDSANTIMATESFRTRRSRLRPPIRRVADLKSLRVTARLWWRADGTVVVVARSHLQTVALTPGLRQTTWPMSTRTL
jgi:hypothetical protein